MAGANPNRDGSTAEALWQSWQRLKTREPGMRARNAAGMLGVPEAALVAAGVGRQAVRLADDFPAILQALERVGSVMALTRNDSAVHERHGVYANGSFRRHGGMHIGLFANADIDLRLFMHHWRSGFAVTEGSGKKVRQSLQFFDKAGTAVHKVYVTGHSDEAAFRRLVETFTHPEQTRSLEFEAYHAPAAPPADDEVDWDAFEADWRALEDTHGFFPLLRRYKVDRQQAFASVGDDLAYRVANTAVREVLEQAAARECPIMVFVGNRGCIQIHGGTVKRLVTAGPWFNVLDPEFNLHLREDHIAGTWVTRKPTTDGIVTALELFDARGGIIATLFGQRKPGNPELEAWRHIVHAVPALEPAHA